MRGIHYLPLQTINFYHRFLGYVSLSPYTKTWQFNMISSSCNFRTKKIQRGESIEPLQLALEIASQNDEELSWTPKGNITFRIRVSLFYSGPQGTVHG